MICFQNVHTRVLTEYNALASGTAYVLDALANKMIAHRYQFEGETPNDVMYHSGST